MKIYITGIAGFLGSHLAKKLKNQGHKVGGNDNMIQGDIENNGDVKLSDARFLFEFLLYP